MSAGEAIVVLTVVGCILICVVAGKLMWRR